MSSTKFKVFLEKNAEKELQLLDSSTRERITEQLRKLRDGFSPELDIKKLKGYKSYYRLRVGDYRAIFDLQPEYTIIILSVLPRKKAYKREL
ncbi:MAG: type II toxin-antitoxin system RelE/ParE family toxin [Candidatus Sigynarchaeota archaeon]